MVYVSHSPRQVLNLCEKGIVLEKSKAGFVGTAKEAVEYLHYSLEEDTDGTRLHGHSRRIPGCGSPKVVARLPVAAVTIVAVVNSSPLE